MDAIELLSSQHLEVDQLFAKIEAAQNPSEKEQLFAELADKLAAHAEIEEKLFYPSVMAKQTEELLLESVEEHLAIKRVLADMLELKVDDDHFDAKLSVMKEQVRHHAHQEEEGELFPKVKRLMSKDELAGLGGELAAMFETVLPQSPRRKVPAQTKSAAPLPHATA
jgi:hemerythrin superfamily protein